MSKARNQSKRPRVPSLSELEKRYARFRRSRSRGSRVPLDLRDATLAVLEAGATGGELQRRCGVSWGQLESWKASRGADEADEADERSVRVLSVVDGEAAQEGPGTDRRGRGPGTEDGVLELRLGAWSVTVRQAFSVDTEG